MSTLDEAKRSQIDILVINNENRIEIEREKKGQAGGNGFLNVQFLSTEATDMGRYGIFDHISVFNTVELWKRSRVRHRCSTGERSFR